MELCAQNILFCNGYALYLIKKILHYLKLFFLVMLFFYSIKANCTWLCIFVFLHYNVQFIKNYVSSSFTLEYVHAK